MATYHCVNILKSKSNPRRHCTGRTTDLEKRLIAHNFGQVRHTAECRPWQIETAISFRSRLKASKFEAYLKSHSGRAFASKYF